MTLHDIPTDTPTDSTVGAQPGGGTVPDDFPRTVPEMVLRSAQRYADREAFIFDDTRETYAELLDRSLEIARALVGLGVQPGDRVGVLLHNSLDYIHLLFGCAFARATAVLMNIRLAPPELAYIARDSGMRFLVTDDLALDFSDLPGRMRTALPGLADAPEGVAGRSDAAPDLVACFLFGDTTARGFLGRAELLAAAEPVSADSVLAGIGQTDPEDCYIMMYTSGTTANPKGCRLPHRSILRTGFEVGRHGFRFTETDKLWNALPLFHVSAQAPMTGVLNAGATYVSELHFDAEESLALILREGVTAMFPAYSTLTQPLLNVSGDPKTTFAGVRAMLTVGPPELLISYQEQLPDTTIHISCYGSTELGGIVTLGRLDDPVEVRATSGKPLSGIELEIRDPLTREVVPAGTQGSIWIRGYNLFTEYHNDPVKTAESHDEHGWFDTGDLGKVDADGNLTFLGRIKDMLKVGGENVACVEIEALLAAHPDVAIAAVIGKPDPKYDEVPVAFVELIPGRSISEEALIDYSRKNLAKWKVPREVRFVTEWPMSITKIQKYKLRELL
ncbi:AMP-binding protein [Nakamurella sp. YIM 132087]|uniref:AMP-binding protein n=1 Tax=Nakamurella alba TaxID=2665158 RepID=A0A7K1FIC8_9ACTN|nr:class I adenylate-forming enzyme family protein [Nakamurella alba]MTD13871.1 AMP-binding protein [Nakamurella alba]